MLYVKNELKNVKNELTRYWPYAILLEYIIARKNMKRLVSFGSRKELDPSSVNFLIADINYTYIYLKDGSKILSSTNLKELESRLKAHAFLRPNRSILVNARFIKGCTSSSIILKNNEIIKISRRRQKKIIEAF